MKYTIFYHIYKIWREKSVYCDAYDHCYATVRYTHSRSLLLTTEGHPLLRREQINTHSCMTRVFHGVRSEAI
jgi:hypothetical protein